jgi:phenylpyruvate tautomerase PptA (4-oxalocrotonate tautomerase family)
MPSYTVYTASGSLTTVQRAALAKSITALLVDGGLGLAI